MYSFWMDMLESESGFLEERVGRRRRMLPEAEWERLLAAYESSGLTQRAFAQQEGISFHTFVGRLNRRRRRIAGDSAVRPEGMRFEELSLSPAFTSALEVQSPDGWVLKGNSPRDLAELVNALRKVVTC